MEKAFGLHKEKWSARMLNTRLQRVTLRLSNCIVGQGLERDTFELVAVNPRIGVGNIYVNADGDIDIRSTRGTGTNDDMMNSLVG